MRYEFHLSKAMLCVASSAQLAETWIPGASKEARPEYREDLFTRRVTLNASLQPFTGLGQFAKVAANSTCA